MKTPIISLIIALITLDAIRAWAADTTQEALQRGLLEEEVNQNLNAAIDQYQAVLAQFGEQRKLAATATFRLGECYRKQGKTNEAFAQFDRVVKEFPDQAALVTLSQKYLADRGPASSGFQTRLQQIVRRAESDDTNTPSTASAFQTRLNQIVRRANPGGEGLSDEESREIQRIQEIIKDSPDLIDAVKTGLTPLHDAASKGQLAVVRFLLENHARVDARTRPPNQFEGAAALHLAANNGHKAIVELLLQNGADVNAKTKNGTTPLQLAAQWGYQAVAQVLLAKGADVNAQDSWGSTALYSAMSGEHRAMMELLLQNKADVNARSNNGGTPLINAVLIKQPATVEFLLAHGADINLGTTTGQTALTTSIQNDTDSITRVLLDHGADPNVEVDFTFSNGASPSYQEKASPLFYASRTGKLALTEDLLKHGATVDVQNLYGRTPLAEAVVRQDVALVDLLLTKSASPNVKDNEGKTPFWLAMESYTSALRSRNQAAPGYGYPSPQDALMMQLQRQANPNLAFPPNINVPTTPVARPRQIPSRSSRIAPGSPAVAAGKDSGLQIIDALLSHGADVNVTPSNAATPLLHAINSGDTNLVGALLEKGADVNLKSSNTYTPLHVAAGRGNTNLMETLLAKGAEINIQDGFGNTPLHYAVYNGQKGAVQVLLAHGAKKDVVNREGLTPTTMMDRSYSYGDWSIPVTTPGAPIGARRNLAAREDEIIQLLNEPSAAKAQ